jgi:hypothetical protein
MRGNAVQILDQIRSEFIGGLPTVLTPSLNIARMAQLAAWITSGWPEDTPYDMALLRLATSTTGYLMGPSPVTVDGFNKARAEHADVLIAGRPRDGG